MRLDTNPATDKYIVKSLEALMGHVKHLYLYSADWAFGEGEFETFHRCAEKAKLMEEEPHRFHLVMENEELALYLGEEYLVCFPECFYEFHCSLENIEKRRNCAG